MLEKKIMEDLKNSMKTGNRLRVSVLRMVRSNIKNHKIQTGQDEMNDGQVISIMQKMAKKHRESIDRFQEGGREDLADKEEREFGVLEEYLPEKMSSEELAKTVEEVIQQTGADSPEDMGLVMKSIMPRVRGKADGKEVNRLVRDKLS